MIPTDAPLQNLYEEGPPSYGPHTPPPRPKPPTVIRVLEGCTKPMKEGEDAPGFWTALLMFLCLK